MRRYFAPYVQVAADNGVGLVLETATWRANQDWARLIGHSVGELAELNRRAVELLVAIRDEHATERSPIVISGCIGPRGDGYVVGAAMSAEEAEAYHGVQIRTFQGTAADLVTAITMTYADEAVGIVRAANAAGLPAVISFTVETDGRLPSGQPLHEAVREVDERSDGGPAYYMLNCAHPSHFADVLELGAPWASRIRGLRANASRMSHAELDESEELDVGDPQELGADYVALRDKLPRLTVLGGCCGTDHRHIGAIHTAWIDADK